MASDTINSNVYEDDKYKYTKVNKDYIKKTMSKWIDEHPGKALCVGSVILSLIYIGALRGMYTSAIYHANVRTIKYLLRHSK